MKEKVSAFIQKHPVIAARWGICILMCSYFAGSCSEPVGSGVYQLLLFVRVLGFGLIVLLPIIEWLTSAPLSLPLNTGSVSRFLNGLVLYSFALWLIGNSGDTIYKWVREHPDKAIVSAVTLVIILMISYLRDLFSSSGYEDTPRALGMASTMASGGLASQPAPTARDNRYMAAHEVGHVLVYAALDCLPGYMKVVLNDHAVNGALGFVTGIEGNHQLQEKTFVEWCMLVFLAGKMGESRLMGETVLGSTADLMRWLDMAKMYLANHCGGIFYLDPKNDFEQKANDELLSALQSDQLSMLDRLFDKNDSVFRDLVGVLLEKRVLVREELNPFLARVEMPEDFPAPVGVYGQI